MPDQTQMYAHTHTHTNKQTNIHTHTYSYAHARTHTHTHTQHTTHYRTTTSVSTTPAPLEGARSGFSAKWGTRAASLCRTATMCGGTAPTSTRTLSPQRAQTSRCVCVCVCVCVCRTVSLAVVAVFRFRSDRLGLIFCCKQMHLRRKVNFCLFLRRWVHTARVVLFHKYAFPPLTILALAH